MNTPFEYACNYLASVIRTPWEIEGYSGYAGRDFYLLTRGSEVKYTIFDGVENPLCRVSMQNSPSDDEWYFDGD